MSAPTSPGVLIIGSGHAGVECAWALRAAGYAHPITLAGEESHLPYERPPLSKGMLLGTTAPERIVLKAAAQYEAQGIVRLSGARVMSLHEGYALTDDGRKLPFRHCVLATGSRARRIAGLTGQGVHVIRNLDDAAALRGALHPGLRLLVVGGGYLGLEAASSAAKLGARVTVLEQASALMGGRVSPHTAQTMGALHQQAGVMWHTDCRIQAWQRHETHWTASTVGHGDHHADLVLVAIGAEPVSELAQAAGLHCADGIVVDEHCRSSNPAIYAIGDCASAWRDELGRHARVESVQNAMAQARQVAAHLSGKPPAMRRAATFWSEQQGRRLQMAGLLPVSAGCRDVLTETAKGWLVERYLGNRLAAIEAVDSPVEFVKGVARLATA